MFFKYLISLVFVFLSGILVVLAQVEEVNLEELLIEQLGGEMDENIDVSEVLERLGNYLNSPLNLNTVTESELSNLVFLSPQQIENILYHRQVSGDFISVLELQGVVGMTPQIINLLQYFVIVGNKSSLKNIRLKDILTNNDQLLMIRYGRNIEKQRGFEIEDETRSRYLGDPNRYAIRYRWNYDNKIKIALNMEKDAGEPFFKEKQRYGFDFYSGHIEFNNLNKYVKKVVVGDYALQFGQGLVLWNGLSFGKGAWIGSVARQGVGLRAYSSLNENNFQRGLSTRIEVGNWDLTPFVAYNNLTGNIQHTDSIANAISSISFTGLHRTPTELANRYQIKQLVYGSNIGYRYKRLKLGLTYMGLGFNGSILKGEDVRNLYDFEGNSLHQVSFSYQTTYRNYYLFGEIAYSFNSGFATLNGLIASLHPKLSLFTTYRNYGRDYHSFFAQSLGESSSVSNEKGIYAGLVFHPSRKIEWVNYVDVFKFPWLRYRVDAPSQGVDFFSQLTYNWYKKGKVSIRFRHRLKQENLALAGAHTNILADVFRDQLRTEYQYKLSELWNIRSRVELAFFHKEKSLSSQGILVYQDVFWRGLPKVQLNIRVAYFDTDGYDSRIYAYENDVLYASSFPVYMDKGWRSYLNMRWRLSKNLDFWTRYALTYYTNKDVIGSGLDEIKGNIKSDIKIQLRWEW